MYTINVGVRQGNGGFQEVRVDNGGRLNLATGDRLVLAAAPENVEIVSGDRGDYVVRLKGGEEFFVASADDAKELVLISPDTGEPLIMFDIQHPEQEVDAHVSQPLGVHQASVAGTEFLQEDVGEDLGMGQLLDMASFSAESGEELTSASGQSFPDWEEPAGTLPGDDGAGDSNSAPSVSGSVDLGSIDEDGSLVFSRADLLATASDADGDALTVTGLSVASGDGTLTDNGDGTWTFAPSADWNGTVIFNYTVSDGNGGATATAANLTVNPVNDAPGIDVNAPINVEAEATVSLAGYLHAGDVDNAASELAYTITHAPEFGTLMLDGVAITDFSGTVFTQADIDAGRVAYRFAPEAGSEIRVVEDDSFTFTVTDGLTATPETIFDVHSIPVQMWGTNGEDTIIGTTATTRADATFLIYGFDGDDALFSGGGWEDVRLGYMQDVYSGAGDDTLYGGSGNDSLVASLGADILDGGDGVDMAYYCLSHTSVHIDLNVAGPQSGGESGNFGLGDVLRGIEDVWGAQNGALGNVITGDDADNVLVSGYTNDTLYGGDGDDSLFGVHGVEVLLVGGSGNDTLNLDYGVAYGGDGDDLVYSGLGRVGSGSLYGGAGNDTLTSGGDHTLEGGAGADYMYSSDVTSLLTVSYSQSLAVEIDLNNMVQVQGNGADGNDAIGDTLEDIWNVIGSSYGDTLIGGYHPNRLDGLEGDDKIYGSNYWDTLIGGGGDDTLDGGAHGDNLDGGDGVDTVDYSSSPTWVNIDLSVTGAQMGGGTGNHGLGDVLTGIENIVGSNDTLYGDMLMGDDADNFLSGLAGDDTLFGNAGNDSLAGGDGDDKLNGGAGADTLDGGSNTVGEAIKYHYNQIGGVLLNPVIRYEATPGGDWADYSASGAAVHVDLTSSGAQSGGHAEGDVLTGIENVIGSAHGDTLIGQDYVSNVFAGLAGADSLVGGESVLDVVEVFDGGWTATTNFYYPDTADYSRSESWVNVDLNSAVGQTDGGAGNHALGDTLAGIENVIGTNDAHGDALTGDGSHNFLDGLAGADILIGGAGDDTLRGGSGADFLDGGTNTDANLHNSGDWVDYSTGTAGVSVDLYLQDGIATQSGGDAEGDTLLGFENVMGSEHDDSIVGDNADNWLVGLAGNDTMIGDDPSSLNWWEKSNDSMWGGAGDDAMFGGAGQDRMWGDSGNDTLIGGTEKDSLYGGDGDDFIMGGNDHQDTLFGGNTIPVDSEAFDNSGDFLSGGAGQDTLFGGGGHHGRETLEGGADGDLLLGSVDGDILAYYANSPSAIYVDLTRQDGIAAQSGGEAEGDTLLGIHHVTGSGFDDTILGFETDNELKGMGGDDFITGGAGQDSLWGDGGYTLSDSDNDTLEGGTGSDFIHGGGGHDIASYRNSAQGVLVDLDDQNYAYPGTPNPTYPGRGEPGQIGADPTGEEHGDWLWYMDGVWGSEHGDTLLGRDTDWDGVYNMSSNDELRGFGGNDSLVGLGGDDSLYGGDGDDTLAGGPGQDLLHGDSGDDLLLGGSDDSVHGGDGFDVFKLEDHSGLGHALDLSAMVSDGRISGIERVDILGDADDANVLTLRAGDVLAVSDTDTLWVRGDGTDEVSTTDSGWSLVASDVVGSDGFEYNHYTNIVGPSVVHLMVAEDITTQNITG